MAWRRAKVIDRAIAALEGDIAGIAEEEEQLRRNVQARRERLSRVLSEVQYTNRVGREDIPEEEATAGSTEEPNENETLDPIRDVEGSSGDDASHPSSTLNPDARPFRPGGLSGSTPLREAVLRRAHETSTSVSAAPSPAAAEEGEEKEDIEMGEVSEITETLRGKTKRKAKEELEEGEASDQSSELSEPPEE